MTPTIKKHLGQDPILRPLIAQIELKERPAQNSVYEALIRSIIFQQLSGKAATTIRGRFLALFEDAYPDPAHIIQLEEETMRSVGLSRQKTNYIKNVANFFIKHDLLDKDWSDEPDEEIIQHLTQIKGVGRWTVEMLLMFTLQRPDVLPLDDLVIRNSMIALYDVEEKGKALKKRLLAIAEPWRPYRTTVSRYLWQWKDTII